MIRLGIIFWNADFRIEIPSVWDRWIGTVT